jgi:hypothetical protein
MSTIELIESAQFLVDAGGHKRAVVLDLTSWREILQKLTVLDDDEAEIQAVREIEARLAAGEERLYSHEEVWAELEALEAQGELPA